MLQKVKQSSPYHCTADAPQKHKTGEFLHLRPGILNGCWLVADGSHCPLYQTEKLLPDSYIMFCQKIQKLSKTLQSYLKNGNIEEVILKWLLCCYFNARK